MAIDDVSFINLRGEEISRTNLVNEMIKYNDLKVQAGETQITDFNEGSEIRNFMESLAVDIYYLMQNENDILKNCYISTASNNWLDRIGEHPFIQLPRNQGATAKGRVTFTLPSALTSDVVIPTGTVVVGDNGLYYSTDSECVILMGELSADVNITCTVAGSDGNVESNTITVIDDSYNNTNNLTVTNNNPIIDGVDYEDDEAYRQRLLDFVRKDDFGSLGYYKRLCEEVAGVHDVVLIDDENYTKKVLVNGTVKPTSDAILLEVLAVLSDLNNTVIGHHFTVDKPVFDSIDLDIDITVKNEMDEDIIVHIIEDLFNGGSREEGFEFAGLNISQGISQMELYSLFDIIDNITNVTITSGGEPVTDIPCETNHVLTTGTITVHQN